MIVSKVSAQSLELEWRPPLGDGGSPVVGYVVEMTETGGGGGGRWLKVGYVSARETRFTVAGLAEGASYFFRVSAENSSGLSRPLQSDCVTPSQPLGTPTTASQGGYIFHAGGSLAGAPAVSPAAGHLTAPTVEGLPGLCENFRPTTSTTGPI